MRAVAASAGFEVVEIGPCLHFYDRGGRGSGIAMAVAGGVAALLWIHVVVWTLLAIVGDVHWAIGPGFAAGASIPTTIAVLARARFRRLRTRPIAELLPLLVVDTAAGCLRAPRGEPIAALAQCRAARAMLIGSSAPSVRISWPGGAREVYRGGFFGGGIADVLALLHRVGLR